MTLVPGPLFLGYFNTHIDHSHLILTSSASLLPIPFPISVHPLYGRILDPVIAAYCTTPKICILSILSWVSSISHHSTSPTLAFLFSVNETQTLTLLLFTIHFLMYLLPFWFCLISRLTTATSLQISLQIPLTLFYHVCLAKVPIPLNSNPCLYPSIWKLLLK